MAFFVFDIDDNINDVSKADFLGKVECTLGQVCSSFFASFGNLCTLLSTQGCESQFQQCLEWLNL